MNEPVPKHIKAPVCFTLFRNIGYFIIALCLSGCAKGSLDILDQNNHVIGQCSANFNWHWYGAQDSVDYLLFICAQGHLEKGRKISDSPILAVDYTIPAPPTGKNWNKKTAFEQFKARKIPENIYGYILADIEYHFIKQRQQANDMLSQGKISKAQYEQLIKQAKENFAGK